MVGEGLLISLKTSIAFVAYPSFLVAFLLHASVMNLGLSIFKT